MTTHQKTRAILDLLEGMTKADWCRIQTLVNRVFDEKEAKVTFEKPEHLDLLMSQMLIK